MLKTIKLQVRGFLFGVFVTVLVIGCCHFQINFRVDPDQQELTQVERLDKQASSELKKFKPVSQMVQK